MKDLQTLLSEQKTYFAEGKTRSIPERKVLLKKLYAVISAREKDICAAIYKDFGKPEYESLLSETQYVLAELRQTIRKLKSWSRPERVRPALVNFPSTDLIYREPYGAVLIISPWNYPFQLAFAPLIGAVAAGNTVVLKPSEITANTSSIIREIIEEVFTGTHVYVAEGDAEVAKNLLKNRWDYIFFTGSTSIGKYVYKAAAEYLTPVTLELGGKNPCIIDETVSVTLTARRIVWGKFFNAGQTCIAPDYLLVHASIKDRLIEALKQEIEAAYGDGLTSTGDMPNIVNEAHFKRMAKLLEGQTVIYGGKMDERTRYVAPTLIDQPEMDSLLMREEIFGPLLPVLTYTDEESIRAVIHAFEKPLSFYVFSKRKPFVKKMLSEFSFGGGIVNDTLVHYANGRLPFGGVGQSGVGAYHGRYSFETFCHRKPVVYRGTWLDIKLRYAPYAGKTKFAKWIGKLL